MSSELGEGVGEGASKVDPFDPTFQAALKRDLDVWAAFCIPEIASLPFPPFYHTVWNLLLQRVISLQQALSIVYRFALGLPRGFAKTTFVKLLVSHWVVYGLRDFPLIVGSREGLAERVVADIADIFQTENLTTLFGSWTDRLEKDTQAQKIGWYCGRQVTLAAIGAGTSVRGINVKHHRPDVLVMDDMQSRENAESPAERVSLERWAVATLFKIVVPKGAFLLFIGNMYNEECLLYKFQQSQQWTTLITGAILSDSESLWPEHKPLEVLREEWEHDVGLGLGDVFYAEVQNDPKAVRLSLLQGKELRLEPPSEYYDATFLTVDPSGIKDLSDANGICVHGCVGEKGYVLAADDTKRLPIDVVNRIIEWSILHRVSLIGIESTAYQSTLMYWIEHFREQRGIEHFPPIVELRAWRRDKDGRILSWVQAACSGMYAIVDEHAYGLLLSEALSYRLGLPKNRDNILDAAAYGLDIIYRYRPQLLAGVPAGSLAQEGRILTGCVLDDRVFRSQI